MRACVCVCVCVCVCLRVGSVSEAGADFGFPEWVCESVSGVCELGWCRFLVPRVGVWA